MSRHQSELACSKQTRRFQSRCTSTWVHRNSQKNGQKPFRSTYFQPQEQEAFMKRLVILLVLFSAVVPAFGDVIKSFSWSGGNSGTWSIEGVGVPGEGLHSGAFTSISTSVFGACLPFCRISWSISGLTLDDFTFQGKFYSTLFLSGKLGFTFAETMFPKRTAFGVMHISGDLTACTDPSCNVQLFPLDLNVFEYPHPSVTFVSSNLASVNFVLAPEPSSLVLLGTGCTLLLGTLRHKRA